MVNVPELAKYFLSNKYINEINKENPLGSKGNLVLKFAALVKNLWFGTSPVFSPSLFKTALGEFASVVIL